MIESHVDPANAVEATQFLIPLFRDGKSLWHEGIDSAGGVDVARRGIIATSFGLRFQGEGYFLTDARMHRGASGTPVVARATAGQSVTEAPAGG